MSAQPDTAALQAELSKVLQAPEFMRAPVLRRLLEYLVDQTVQGNGPRLKAYQIAVEGLGRDDSFDPQSDSYPRVQVGRLRKMLDLHYAALAPEQARDRQRLVIPMGQYDVQLGQIQVAAAPPVPSGGGSHAEAVPAEDAASTAAADMAPARPVSASPSPGAGLDRGWVAWVVRILLLLALLYVIWLLTRPADDGDTAMTRNFQTRVPHLTIQIDPASSDDRLATAAQIAEMYLQRFEMLAVSQTGRDAAFQHAVAGREYLLLLRGGASGRSIFITLRHAASDTTLWSQELKTEEAADVESAIGTAVSQIARSGGLIAQHQRRLTGNDMRPGYACLIQYDSFRQRRDPALRAPLETCLKQSLERYPNEPLFLQALSYLALSRPQATMLKPLIASGEGRRLADLALQYGGNSSLAQIAVSRSALARGNCPRSIAFARRAVESNPLEPDTLGLAGTFLMSCGDYAGAESVLDKAIALQSDSGGYHVSALVIVRVVNGHAAQALDLAMRTDTPELASQPNFLLAKALALAANGRSDAARLSWQQLAELVGEKPDAPVDAVLGRFTMSAQFTRKMQAEAARLGLG